MAGALAYPDWEAMASTNEPLEEDWEKIPDNSMALSSYGSLRFSTVHFWGTVFLIGSFHASIVTAVFPGSWDKSDFREGRL